MRPGVTRATRGATEGVCPASRLRHGSATTAPHPLLMTLGDVGAPGASVPSLAVFEGCPPELLAALRPVPEELDVDPGETIVREGHVGHEWYVVLDGSVEVLRGGHSLAELGVGDHFGEIALLFHQPRTVTVRAARPTRVLMVPEPAFQALLVASPSFSARVRRAAEERRAFLEQVSTPPG